MIIVIPEYEIKLDCLLNKQAHKLRKTDSDVIIVRYHVIMLGANNVKSYSPQNLGYGISFTLEKIQNDNPSTNIAFSTILKREDDH